MTFTEYINRQRIAYAKKLMQQNPTLGRAEIAERSGYVSVSSFYRNLKEYGG
jgi:YesN/AraC family two-component response regulator